MKEVAVSVVILPDLNLHRLTQIALSVWTAHKSMNRTKHSFTYEIPYPLGSSGV